jgi:hypothetical protein
MQDSEINFNMYNVHITVFDYLYFIMSPSFWERHIVYDWSIRHTSLYFNSFTFSLGILKSLYKCL